jgi:hypothetical protein
MENTDREGFPDDDVAHSPGSDPTRSSSDDQTKKNFTRRALLKTGWSIPIVLSAAGSLGAQSDTIEPVPVGQHCDKSIHYDHHVQTGHLDRLVHTDIRHTDGTHQDVTSPGVHIDGSNHGDQGHTDTTRHFDTAHGDCPHVDHADHCDEVLGGAVAN